MTEPIPRERALVPVHRRRSHWVPVSERTGTRQLVSTLRDDFPIFAAVAGHLLGVPEPIQRRLDDLAIEHFWEKVLS